MSKKKAEFPKVIRVGQTRATIYKTPRNSCDAYTVIWYEGAVRKRKMFADPGLAEIHASAQVNNLSEGETRAAKLTGEECLEYVRAKNAVKGFSLTLDTAMAEYCEAKQILKGTSLIEAARYFAEKRRLHLPEDKTVSVVYNEMIKAKRDEGCSERYIQDLESRVGKFAKEFSKQIWAVTGLEIKAWLQALVKESSKTRKDAPKIPVSNRTKNNFRLGIQTLFSFAKGEKYLPLDWNEMEAVPVWKTKDEGVDIFAPDEITLLLALAPDNLIPFLTIGAFAGLRSAEIERLDWSKVNLESGYITVDASIAKTNSRRLVPITPNLKLWLKDCVKPRGPVLELANVVNAVARLVNSTRLPDPKRDGKVGEPRVLWKHNALRHSFCSYRLADVKSAAQAALEAGNSPQMIFEHYRELVGEKESEKWFSITPDVVKVVREKEEQDRAEREREEAEKIVALPVTVAA